MKNQLGLEFDSDSAPAALESIANSVAQIAQIANRMVCRFI